MARRSPTSGPGPPVHTAIRRLGKPSSMCLSAFLMGGPRSRPTRCSHASSLCCPLSLRLPLLKLATAAQGNPGRAQLLPAAHSGPGLCPRADTQGEVLAPGAIPSHGPGFSPSRPVLTTRGSAPQARGSARHDTSVRGHARISARLRQWYRRVPPYLYFACGSVRRTHCIRGSAGSRGPRSPHRPRGRLRFKRPQRRRCINSCSAPASVDQRVSRGDRECGAGLGMAVNSGG
ncbi:hypothetical protein NDU88_007925 [Pleurodeles waltl]|uniref:Uncharacterized protein n=1 Tax=Pleurodeles waltl TaxID=8319 RepID=A0AAV7N6S1_PLEWA|nr:hypothetical protein NDU88_007925 [Pleurodeles waltl]